MVSESSASLELLMSHTLLVCFYEALTEERITSIDMGSGYSQNSLYMIFIYEAC